MIGNNYVGTIGDFFTNIFLHKIEAKNSEHPAPSYEDIECSSLRLLREQKRQNYWIEQNRRAGKNQRDIQFPD